MDNMLYIIAGLVFILLIAVLLIRKNKAKKPSEQPLINAEKSTLKEASTLAETTTDKKFNHIEIAQRFMDQQRYDKAIETLNRGLTEIPNDSQLSLKLLAVYATIDQSDNFNKVYDSIKAHADAKSIAQADELKALLTEEQNQAAIRALPADNDQDVGFESIDFDIPANKVESQHSAVDVDFEKDASQTSAYSSDLADSSNTTLETSNDFDNIEQAFELSLDDLQEDSSEPAVTSTTPITELDITDEEVNSSESASETDFDFDLAESHDTSSKAPITTLSNDYSNDIILDDNEDFVLDLADLEIQTIDENVNNEIATEATLIEQEDFTLSLDPNANSDAIDTFAVAETTPSSETPVFIADDFEDFIFDDNEAQETNEAIHETPTTVVFDDTTLIDDDFDFGSLSDAPTATTPVDLASEIESNVDSEVIAEHEIESAEDFSSRFAADFDFVKTLDSNQVTLDLAGQYVQLGEYDSAKRLLNEVISQGTSEQQSQAQTLLDRTA
ncbi:FimV/HubP family polar landmark protein [Psychrobacter immobilis]|uniref:FimV/HubP family polar landmark protein n=1 Tax=Psychrobacter immobilis TaxID=498 RepID=UPI00191812C7|nr:FimV/HubP family polar landmark protein [Psychrobacter immobilis]